MFVLLRPPISGSRIFFLPLLRSLLNVYEFYGFLIAVQLPLRVERLKEKDGATVQSLKNINYL